MTTHPFKLKIELIGLPFKVIRIVLVPQRIRLFDLHMIIQGAMGWTNSHLYEFMDRNPATKIRLGVSSEYDSEFDDMGLPVLRDAKKVYFNDVFYKENGGKPFWYKYDFGDGWQHRVSFQKADERDKKNFFGLPLCIKAVGKCPPEDVGGLRGYIDFLGIVANKKNPEYRDTIQWAGLGPGEVYDKDYVNIDLINDKLLFGASWALGSDD